MPTPAIRHELVKSILLPSPKALTAQIASSRNVISSRHHCGSPITSQRSATPCRPCPKVQPNSRLLMSQVLLIPCETICPACTSRTNCDRLCTLVPRMSRSRFDQNCLEFDPKSILHDGLVEIDVDKGLMTGILLIGFACTIPAHVPL